MADGTIDALRNSANKTYLGVNKVGSLGSLICMRENRTWMLGDLVLHECPVNSTPNKLVLRADGRSENLTVVLPDAKTGLTEEALARGIVHVGPCHKVVGGVLEHWCTIFIFRGGT